LTCFTASTLPLYRDLNVLPSTRFVQMSTVRPPDTGPLRSERFLALDRQADT
jgi:hypothetical protein